MSAATGLSVVDVFVLDTFHAFGARPDRPYVKTKRLLDALFDRHDIAPRPGYQVVCDLARPWRLHLLLVDFNGNVGSPDFEPAASRYTEVRLSRLGAAAVAAEQGEIGALPIGLINGNTNVDGPRPPLDPSRVVAALRAAATASDDELVAMVGLPSFPGACDVRGDIELFASGQATTLQLSAHIAPLGAGRWRITNLPPDVGGTQIVMALTTASERLPPGWSGAPPKLPIHHIDDATFPDGPTMIDVVLEPEVDADQVIAAIADLWGVRTQIEVALGDPLAAVLRRWVERYGRGDLESRLRLIEDGSR